MQKKKQLRKQNRLNAYDYSQNGMYFVTICTKGRKEYFGEIKDGEMILNNYGKVVEEKWLWLAQQYDYVFLDDYVIMPNHLHGILIIDDTSVVTGRDLSLRGGEVQKKIKPLSGLVGAFKTISSKKIHLSNLEIFSWQRSFHDHIIRKQESLEKIRFYIQKNPENWKMDINNINNI